MPATALGQEVDRHITSVEDLRSVIPHPSHLVENKVIDHIDDLAARFIAAAPLTIMATKRADGRLDQTPRGDPPGFVKVLNDQTLAMPDWPGNRRMDAFENILREPAVGLLFIIPGHRETLRISGRAAIVQDAALSEQMAVAGHLPKLVLLIDVQRVLCHCAKAFIRSKTWQPEAWPDTAGVPTLAEMMKAHGALVESLPMLEARIHQSDTEWLYARPDDDRPLPDPSASSD